MSLRKIVASAIFLFALLSFAFQTTTFISLLSTKSVDIAVYASPGIPVSGAIVTAYGENGYGYAVTNAMGQYTITEGLPAGNYTMMVMKEGYINGEKENVTVAVGSETSGVNLYMNLSGGIAGKVTDSISGLGIPNLTVMAMLSSGGGTYFGTASTDVAGNYEMNMNLGTGNYNVTLFLPKGYVGNSTGPVSVTAGSVTTGVNLALERSGIISGRVTVTPSGEPLANATVTAFLQNGEIYYGTDQTNATGYYRIGSGLGTGSYTVMAMDGGMPAMVEDVAVTAGSETSNVDLQLLVSPPPPSGILMGKVTDESSGEPIVDAQVEAEGDTTMSFGFAYTDDEGNYIISENLETDTYTVTVTASGYRTENQTNVDVVVDEVTSDVNFQLLQIPAAQSGTISGTVTGDADPIPEFEYPVAVMLIMTLVAVAIAKSTISRKEALKGRAYLPE